MTAPVLSDDSLLDVLHDAATAVRAALDELRDWGPAGTRPGQYHSDVAADAAAVEVLERAGLGVLSEESGARDLDRDVVVVLDPVDGSTNASRGLPWFATSLCAVDADGPRAAVVVDQASGLRYEAVRGAGARAGGVRLDPSSSRPMRPSPCTELHDAIVGLSGWPALHLGWRQFRALGALALDLCAVAGGGLDAYVDCSRDAHGPWDYLGAVLICREAGAHVGDAFGRDLVVLGHDVRRTPVAASTLELYDQVVAARRSLVSLDEGSP